MRAGFGRWCCLIVAVWTVRGAEGSNGCKSFVSDAESTKKSPIKR